MYREKAKKLKIQDVMNVESTCWAIFRGGAKASQAACSVSLATLRSPQIGAGFLPLSTITLQWLVKWGALISDVSSLFFSIS